LKMKMLSRIALGLFASVTLAGCATGPAYQPPSPPASALGNFTEGLQAGVSEAQVPAQWWRLFNSPQLDGLVMNALAANADLRVATARLETARAAVREADAARLPTAVVESNLSADRHGHQPSTSSLSKTSYDMGVTVAYEIDLFGRLRWGSGAALADAQASAAALDAVRVLIAADTASAFLDLCGASVQASVAREQIAAQRRSYALVAEQLREGEVSPLELAQARTQLALVQSTLPAYEAAGRQAQFRLATLQGRPASEAVAQDVTCEAPPKIVGSLPVGDGAALIARRPDIREAERRLAAATRRIGMATADLYPRMTFAGSLGLLSGRFDAFLTPLVTWAFPNRQLAEAKIAGARGVERAALAQWDAVMLRALQEVETVLTQYRSEQQRRDVLTTARAEADVALRRASARYRLGADSYLAVLDAERTRNSAANELVGSDVRLAQLQVALFRALGGGWETPSSSITSEDPHENTDS
jgi:NodT family efflux transporter outer membrane factor (OMF) lipoprotein